jgi:hypothetical protein
VAADSDVEAALPVDKPDDPLHFKIHSQPRTSSL